MIDLLPIALAGKTPLGLLPGMANRHGLITGATGTGKTVTLQVMAERLSALGVPVFMADVKGDLSGLAMAGSASTKFDARLQKLGMAAPAFTGFPVTLWDVFGEQGHPMRATVTDLGPLLMARMLGLNDTQEGVLNLVFRIADERGLLLLDAKDLRAMLQFVGDNAKDFTTEFGNVSAASIGAIQRSMLKLSDQGGDKFLGEPALNLDDMLQTDAAGRGVLNILAADKLMNAPQLYASFLLWLLSDLYERLPEIGDPDKPKMVFFFDEAHLLFTDAPKALLQKVEQVVRLIRSKGVGVYFVTQNPLDVPDTVVGQLGNRVQHALRAFTARDQKAVQAAADTLRANPRFNAAQAITELEVGEALVSFFDDHGRPNIVERAYVMPPASRIGPLTPAERVQLRQTSLVAGVYEKVLDRESAYEKLKGVVAPDPTPAAPGSTPAQAPSEAAASAPAAGNGAPADPAASGWGRSSGASGAPVGSPAGASPGAAHTTTAGPTTAGSPGTATPTARPMPMPTTSGPAQPSGQGGMFGEILGGLGGMLGRSTGRKDSVVEALAKSAARSIGSTVGREIVRGVLGSIMGGRKR